jgi:hypothetical protein
MTTRQENFVRMVNTVNEILKDNHIKWTGVKRFARSAEELNQLLELNTITGAKANSTLTGATKDKHSLASKAMKAGVKIAKRASIYALDESNMELHDKLRISRSMLLNKHEAEALKTLKDVIEQLTPIVGELADYAIVPADLTDLKKLVDDYAKSITKPRELTTVRTTINETLLPELINKMRAVLYQLDSFIGLFDHTPFEAEYLNARKVINLGSRHETPDNGAEPESPAK